MTDRPSHNASSPNRREFILASAGLSAAALASIDAVAAETVAPLTESLIQRGETILFQGDSITDAGRKQNDSAANSQRALGNGYAWLAAAELLVDHPDDGLKIFNRGISGNKVYQLAERWQADCLDLKPDVLSILIGVNDYWHKVKHSYAGTLEIYETDFRALVARTKDALPNVKLVVCEPFVLKFGAVEDSWFPDFDGYRAAAKRVAEEAGATFVPYQTMFDRAIEIAPPQRWLVDGVHPTSDGAALMAHWWLRAVGA
jgi:lysophospholipase L1-like esterase